MDTGFCNKNYSDSEKGGYTVGAQSTARLCRNLVNCRGNISAHRRRRKLRFFLFERSSAGEWIKILTDVKILKKLLHKMSLNWHTKKFTFWGVKCYKKIKKDNFKKKNWGDSSLGYNKLIVR